MAQMKKKTILGFRVDDRPKHIPDVQTVLTELGCCIKTRIGLHDVNDNWCSPNGTILLELFGEEAMCKELETRLRGIEGVAVQKMEFE
ncbi:MAG TPA: hypothetical protein DFS52_03905 [Myxococcales bacterium]|jgi:hypothetical protein|nr:hypothetical protein [Myxococcales bacterium]